MSLNQTLIKIFVGLMLLASPLASWAQNAPPNCSAWLKAYVIYEDEIGGKIVLRHNTYPLVDWDPNSQFDGILLVKALPASSRPILEVEFRSVQGGNRKVETFKNLLPFERDARLKHFDDFRPTDFFRFDSPGVFSVRLKSGAKTICLEKHTYSLGH